MTNDDGVWKGLVMTPLTQIQTLGGDKINKKVWCKPWNIVMKWDIYKLAPLLPKKENT